MNNLIYKAKLMCKASLAVLVLVSWSVSVFATPLTIGEIVNGEITTAGEVHTYSFTLGEPQNLYFDSQSGSRLSIDWALNKASGELVFDNQAWSDQEVSMLDAGNYELTINGRSGATPSYQFQVFVIPAVSSTAINIDEVILGQITTPGEVHNYTFTLTEPQNLYFDSRVDNVGSRLSVDWALYTETGELVFENNAWSDQEGVVLDVGNYVLEIDGSGDATPEYQFQVVGIPDTTSIPFDLVDIVQGEIAVQGQVNQHTFSTSEERVVFFDRQDGSTLSLNWLLRDSLGNEIFNDSNWNDVDIKTLPAGDYTLLLDGIGDSITPYQFQLHIVPETTITPIDYYFVNTGLLTVPGQKQRFTLELEQPTDISVERITGTSGSAYTWSMFDSSGSQKLGGGVFNGLVGQTAGTILPAGSYTLEFDGNGDHIGKFNFRVWPVSQPAPQLIELEQMVSGRLTEYMQIREYQFEADSSAALYLNLHYRSSPLPTYTLYSPSGARLFNSVSNNQSIVSLPEGGTYRLIVAANAPTTNNYSFQLSSASDQLTIPAAADLVVTSASVDYVPTDQLVDFTISWTVTNNGAVATSASSWKDRIYFRSAAEFSLVEANVTAPVDFIVADDVIRGDLLPAGESYTATVTVQFPRSEAVSEAFDIVIEVDAENQVFEAVSALNEYRLTPTVNLFEQRQVSANAVISSNLADGSLLPSNVPITLGGNANLAGGSVNLFFVIDASLSTAASSGSLTGLDANGDGVSDEQDDFNGDGINGDVLDVEMGAVLTLSEQFSQSSDDLLVSLIQFGGDAFRVDLGVERHLQLFQRPFRQGHSDSSSDFQHALTTHFDRQFGTQFGPPISEVLEYVQIAPQADQNIVFFLTDGIGGAASEEQLAALGALGVSFYAFQIGLTDLSASLQAAVDGINAQPNSTAIGFPVENPGDLPQIALGALQLVAVEINNQPVEALDAAGNFFQTLTLNEGDNLFTIAAIDAQGSRLERTVSLIGATSQGDDLSNKVGAQGALVYTGTFFNRSTNRLFTQAQLQNTGSTSIDRTVEVVMDIAPAAVNLSTAQRTTSNGQAIVLFDDELGAGLSSGQLSQAKTMTFANPRRDRISLYSSLLTAQNSAPYFVSAPVVSVADGSLYEYQAEAADVDGDSLEYQLTLAPIGMTIDALSGAIVWQPDSTQSGTHQVILTANDGKGATAQQGFLVSVTTQGNNLPPIIISQPTTKFLALEGYDYQVIAVDPEGGALSYAFISGPAELSLDSTTGKLQAAAGALNAGSYPITLLVSDTSGGQAHQSWTLQVKGDNQPPIIVSTPSLQVGVQSLYQYDLAVSDDDSDLSFTLIQGPVGMSINPLTGQLNFRPQSGQVGVHSVTIRVEDPYGKAAQQSYQLTVTEDDENPQVSIVLTTDRVALGSLVEVTVSASDNAGIASVELTYAGVLQTLNATGSTSIFADQAGVFELVATVVDSNGLVTSESASLRVVDPNDTEPPTVAITSPEYGSLTSYLTSIAGSVSADDLHEYRLDYSLASQFDIEQIANDGPQWTTFARGNTQVDNAELGTLDATVMRNDSYIVRLLAEDLTGNRAAIAIVVNVNGKAKLGEFKLTYTDLQIPVANMPIEIKRIYQTTHATVDSDFGYGWRLQLSDPDIRETVPVAYLEESLGLFVNNPYQTDTRVYLNAPDGNRIGFTFTPEIGSSMIGTVFTPKFTADPGVFYQLEVDPTTLSQASDGSFNLFLIGFDYNPQDFRLIEPNGTTWHYNQFDGLQRVTDRQGNELEYTDNGIFHSSGLAVTFERDPQGRITSITDTAGNQLQYGYNNKGELIEFTDRAGDSESYSYLDTPVHFMQTITDNSGTVIATLEFDESGRMSGLTNGVGERISQDWSIETFSGTITDAKGNITELTYDLRGNILTEQDPLGGVTSYTYDEQNNQLTKTDANGHTTGFAYDSLGNVISRTDAMGNMTQFGFDSYGNSASVTNALGHTTSSIWDEQGNLSQITLSNGKQSNFSYDQNGRLTSMRDFNGNLTTFEYTSSFTKPTKIVWPDGSEINQTLSSIGELSSVTDEQNQTIQVTRDAQGRIIEQIDAGGNSYQWQYQDDLVASYTDPLGRTKHYQYDNNDSLTITQFADGSTNQNAYDANGNLIRVTDALGNETTFGYDQLNRLVSRTDATGATETYQYDPVGNLIHKVDRRGKITAYTYDSLNRMVTESWLDTDDNVLWQINKSYDALGNVVTLTDAYSSLSNTYNANNLLTSQNISINAGPSSTLTFNYDANDNLISVTDSQATQEVTYNNRNLVERLSLSSHGQQVATELSYDARGLRATINRSLDNNLVGGSQYEFDNRGLSQSITHSQDSFTSSFSYQFDANSRVIAQQNDQEDISYQYDTLDQLIAADRSEQADESYSFDSQGNPSGTGIEIGTANRLLATDDFTYSYDAAGNMIKRTNKDTLEQTRFAYDHRNRLIQIQTLDNDENILSEINYGYDPLDRRVMRQVGDQIEYRNYVMDDVWADMDSEGDISKYYLNGANTDEKVARISQGQIAWYLTDRQQSVFDIIDSNGAPINQLEYDSFGQVISESNPADGDRFSYTGRELEREVGVYDYRRRTYDPIAKRFTTEDPIGFDAGDSNLYRYVFNNPLQGTDPTGEIVATEYANVVCEIVMPQVKHYQAIGECVQSMYQGIASAIEVSTSDDSIVPQFGGCLLNIMLASIEGHFVPSPPEPEDLACAVASK